MRSFLLAAALAAVSLTGACSKSKDSTEEHKSNLPTVTIDELDSQITAKAAVAVDANGDSTRKKMGVIPGAILLSDGDELKAAELPTDKGKPLVFYCANTHCGASHEAAAQAITAGYTNVKVLPDGIAGWVKAGKKVDAI